MAKTVHDPLTNQSIEVPDEYTQAQVQGVVTKMRQAYYNQQGQLPTQGPSAAGLDAQVKPQDPGFLGEMYNNNVKPIKDVIEQFQANQQQGQQQGGAGEVGATAFAIPKTAMDVGGAMLANQARPWQRMAQDVQAPGDARAKIPNLVTDALEGVTPFVGPMVMDMFEHRRQGSSWPTILADAVSLGGALFGPEMLRGAARETIGKTGDTLYKWGLPIPDEFNPTDRAAIVEQGRKLGVRAGSEADVTKVQSDLDATKQSIRDFLGEQLPGFWGGKSRELVPMAQAGAGFPNPTRGQLLTNPGNVVQGLIDEAKRLRFSAMPEMADPFLDRADTALRVLGKNPTLEQLQTYKENTWHALSDSIFGKDSAAVPGSKQSAKLLGLGAQKEIERFGDLGDSNKFQDLNRRIQTNIWLRDSLKESLEKDPHFWKQALPWVLYGAAADAGNQLFGHNPYMPMGAATGVGLAAGIARAAGSDPRVLTRLGLAMSKAGNGTMAKFVSSIAPKASLALRQGQDETDRKPQ